MQNFPNVVIHTNQCKGINMTDTRTDLVDRVLDAIAARIIATCNHPEAGMEYPCCEDCWDKSRMVKSQKHQTEGTQ